jgi:hypothetical protein
LGEGGIALKFVNFSPQELILLAKILRMITSGAVEIPGLTAEEKEKIEPLRYRIERKGWV